MLLLIIAYPVQSNFILAFIDLQLHSFIKISIPLWYFYFVLHCSFYFRPKFLSLWLYSHTKASSHVPQTQMGALPWSCNHVVRLSLSLWEHFCLNGWSVIALPFSHCFPHRHLSTPFLLKRCQAYLYTSFFFFFFSCQPDHRGKKKVT